MEPLKFLEVALPLQGFKCITELTTNKKEKAMAESIEDLRSKYDEFNSQQYDIFTPMASFQSGTSRLGVNAQYVRCLWIDLDCKHPKDIVETDKPYGSAKEALVALEEFLGATGLGALGAPWLNSSGGGVHAYWPFTADIEVAQWRVAAENLKRLCKDQGLDIDWGVTADVARLMRTPGTINTGMKGGKQVREATRVRQVTEGDIFDFEEVAALLVTKLNGHAYESTQLQLAGTRPTRAPGTGVKLYDPTDNPFTSSFKKIVQGAANDDGCKQIAWWFENGQKDDVEPIWRGILSIAKHCDDSAIAVKKVTAVHGYDSTRLLRKLDEIKGPYPCTKIDSENPGLCPECPHWGKKYASGKPWSPITLGNSIRVDDTEKTIRIDRPEPGDPIVLTRPEPPYHYHYAAKGGIVFDEVKRVGQEDVKKEWTILPYDMYVVDILDINGAHDVQFMAHRPEGVTIVTIPQKAVSSKEECIKHLSSQNIMCGPYAGANGDIYLHGYIRGSVQMVSSNKAAVKVPDSMGWQQDGSFVLSDRVYSPGGKVAHVPMKGLENITRNMKITGNMEGWKRFVNILLRQKLYGHIAFGCIGFGAPLMRFMGLDGMTFHACSTNSGSGKTLALDMAASIWGHPQHYRTGAGTSDVTLQQRAGLLHSLPLLSDEITSKQHTTPEWLPEFLLSICNGKGKERMEAGANKERLNLSTWATLCAISSNTHGMDYLSGGREHSSQGEIYRFLEWNVTEKNLFFDTEESNAIIALRENFGLAGELYAKWLINNTEIVRQVVEEVKEKIKQVLKAIGEERYWVAGITCVVAGSILAGKNYANIIDLPVDEIIKFFKGLVSSARIAQRSSARTAEDVLNAYTREYFGQMVVIKDNVLAIGDEQLTDRSTTRTKVMGRSEHSKDGKFVDYYIAETEMRKFCTTKSFSYADFKKDLGLAYRVEELRKDLLQNVKGPAYRTACLKITMANGSNKPEEDDAEA